MATLSAIIPSYIALPPSFLSSLESGRQEYTTPAGRGALLPARPTGAAGRIGASGSFFQHQVCATAARKAGRSGTCLAEQRATRHHRHARGRQDNTRERRLG